MGTVGPKVVGPRGGSGCQNRFSKYIVFEGISKNIIEHIKRLHKRSKKERVNLPQMRFCSKAFANKKFAKLLGKFEKNANFSDNFLKCSGRE